MKEIFGMVFSLLRAMFYIGSTVLLVGTAGYGIYSSADEAGQIPHSVETSISAQENWLVGESKDCTSPVLDAQTSRFIHEEPGYVAYFLTCDNGPQHAIKVTFYGRLNQPEHKLISWRCTRKTEGFTCRQKGAD